MGSVPANFRLKHLLRGRDPQNGGEEGVLEAARLGLDSRGWKPLPRRRLEPPKTVGWPPGGDRACTHPQMVPHRLAYIF